MELDLSAGDILARQLAEAVLNLTAERDALAARVEALEGALREAEWNTVLPDDSVGDIPDRAWSIFTCPCCGGLKPRHQEGCSILAALAPPEEPSDG